MLILHKLIYHFSGYDRSVLVSTILMETVKMLMVMESVEGMEDMEVPVMGDTGIVAGEEIEL